MCMKRLAIDTEGCGQLTSNYTYFSDSCFSSVKTADESMATGVDYCGSANTSHKGFFLATLEKCMKYWQERSYLVMKSTTRVPGVRSLLYIG